MTGAAEPPNSVNLNIDISRLQAIAHTGVRRAVGFLGLGLSALANGPPKSVTLENQFTMTWFPDPLPDDTAAEIALEFETWLVGSALRELDQYLSRFLDEIWQLVRLTELHGRKMPSDFGRDARFDGDTNTARKLRQVEETIAAKGIASDFFDGYSLARNAISHNLGWVRPRDTNKLEGLVVQWHAPTVIVAEGENEHIIDQTTGMPDRAFGEGSIVKFRMAPQEKAFAVGSRVVFSRFELCGICLSYQSIADAIAVGMQEFMGKKGIGPSPH
jgi:hypothetical protein